MEEMKKNAMAQLRNEARLVAKTEAEEGVLSREYARARVWLDAQQEAYQAIGLLSYEEVWLAIGQGIEDAHVKG